MRYCPKCAVSVRGDAKSCPLCQSPLSGEAEEASLYPPLPTLYRQHELFFKLLLLGTAAAAIISVAVNLILPQSGAWSLFVLLGAACFWISLYFAIRRLHSLPKNLTNQVVLGSLLAILWDWATGWHGWSLDYVLPVLCAGAMVTLGIVAWVRRMPVEDYLGCLIADAVLGILPLIFLLCGLLHVMIPSVICVALGLILLVALWLFMGKSLWDELVKRFHM